jgi:hypothetical protein
MAVARAAGTGRAAVVVAASLVEPTTELSLAMVGLLIASVLPILPRVLNRPGRDGGSGHLTSNRALSLCWQA